jgi:hypothetical protein
MKHKLIIRGISKAVDMMGREFFDCFEVMDSKGNRFNLDVSICGEINELYDMNYDEQVEWAKSQIGKHVFCDDMSANSFIAMGKTYIV